MTADSGKTKIFSNLRYLGHGKNEIRFRAADVDVAIVNALRRAILAYVPTACFVDHDQGTNGTIEIRENNTVLHNEMLAQRISMIPVCLTENELLDVVEGSATYEFALTVKNETRDTLYVTSADITGTRNGKSLTAADRLRLFPAEPFTKDYVPIVPLRPSVPAASTSHQPELQEVDIRMRLRVGTGLQHARWQPVSKCAFGNVVDDAKASAALQALLAQLREGGNITEREVERAAHDFNALDRQRYFITNQHNEPGAFDFVLRSECGLRPTYIVFKAFAVLQQRVSDLATRVKTAEVLCEDAVLSPATVSGVCVCPVKDSPHTFRFIVMGEDHTVGYLVQSLTYNAHVRSETTDLPLDYIGYHETHPLEGYIEIKVKFAGSPPSVSDATERMSRLITEVAQEVELVMQEWIRFCGLQDAGIRDVLATGITSGN